MNIDTHIAGVMILLIIVTVTQILVFVRTVSSIKSRLHTLKNMQEDALREGNLTPQYAKAFAILNQLHHEKLQGLRRTVWGWIFGHILSDSSHEKSQH